MRVSSSLKSSATSFGVVLTLTYPSVEQNLLSTLLSVVQAKSRRTFRMPKPVMSKTMSILSTLSAKRQRTDSIWKSTKSSKALADWSNVRCFATAQREDRISRALSHSAEKRDALTMDIDHGSAIVVGTLQNIPSDTVSLVEPNIAERRNTGLESDTERREDGKYVPGCKSCQSPSA